MSNPFTQIQPVAPSTTTVEPAIEVEMAEDVGFQPLVRPIRPR